MSWDRHPVSDAELQARLAAAARAAPQPEVRRSADRAARYDSVATLLSAAQAAGLAKVGFITDPAAGR
nr:biopolymer transporter ExbD [Burkholderia lata]